MLTIVLSAAVATALAQQPLPSAAAAPQAAARFAAMPPSRVMAELQRPAAPPKLPTDAVDRDVEPPILSQFESKTTVNAGGLMTIKLQVSDDLSGIASIYARAVGPGANIWVELRPSFPRTTFSGKIVAKVSEYTTPGTYTFDRVDLYDGAGSGRYYGAAALAAMGNTQVVVRNTHGSDGIPPTLNRGQILTPELSVSAYQPGTIQAAVAGVMLAVTDTGETRVSGAKQISVEFCKLDQSKCFDVSGYAGLEGRTSHDFEAGGRPAWRGATAGNYYPMWVTMLDWAGNTVILKGTRFGGSTDFSTLFVNGDQITLTP
ncbi:hypothetical protein [Ideonella aquatica]|uniref:hypothetical protein n=1 Tax=Ideonella aquatica TaxID=2824119 RepID=UPI001FFCAD47|nr:hypothetical protein [Ideonella aquatica]